ncbi:methionine--tRNA ligase [Planctomycetota bacterium]|nr:methionine--tRNA ligase [Planctomycetota bacterium]
MRHLVTAALPYVTGDIHLGHLVEHVQCDLWVRFRKMQGDEVVFLCADDVHGTGTMLTARKRGLPESTLIAELGAAHVKDFKDFGIAHDHYGSTDSPSAKAFVEAIWSRISAGGHVARRSVTQLYDPVAGSFLADRFVKGTCPKCGSADQYGDACEKCNATYSPSELKDARSVLSGAVPELRSADHCFIKLEDFRSFLDAWTQSSGALSGPIARWIKGAFLIDGEPLRDWDVSRPAPYFGFEIPDAPGNYFYVWVDAPVGYLGSLADWCAQDPGHRKRQDWWPMVGETPTEPLRIHHVIGKDITYFHTLFWPAMLHASGWRLPDRIRIHGWLTVDGDKMSKSRGTFINARTYLDVGLDPAYLRYYLASKLNGSADDLDLNLKEFTEKVNADLVGKVVNLASRCARMISRLDAVYPDDGGRFATAATEGSAIAAAYDADDSSQAIRRIMALADRANEYVEQVAPWSLKKDPARAAELAQACTVALNLFRQLTVYLAPVLPRLAEQAGELLSAPITRWSDAQKPILGTAITPFARMLDRVDPALVAKLVVTAAEPAAASQPAAPGTQAVAAPSTGQPAEPLAATITIDDFAKIDLRVAKVLSAEEVPKAKKILKLRVDLGSLGERTIFAGIRLGYPAPAALVGRLIVVCANLAPRQMSFGTSEGMVVAAGGGEPQQIFVLSPDSGAAPGQRIG